MEYNIQFHRGHAQLQGTSNQPSVISASSFPQKPVFQLEMLSQMSKRLVLMRLSCLLQVVT